MTIKYDHNSKSVSEIMSKSLEAIIRRRGFGEGDIVRHWSQVIGEDLSQKCLPSKFARSEKIFYIYSKDLEFKAHFKYYKATILERLQTFFGKEKLEVVKLIS